MSGSENGRGNALRYLIVIFAMIVIYVVIVGSFITVWQLAHNLGIYMALSLCVLASLFILTLGSRILWRLVNKLSRVR